MSPARRCPMPPVRLVYLDAEALRPLLRRLVWCEADGARWAGEAIAEAERVGDGALAEIADEERKRCAMRGASRGRLVQ